MYTQVTDFAYIMHDALGSYTFMYIMILLLSFCLTFFVLMYACKSKKRTNKFIMIIINIIESELRVFSILYIIPLINERYNTPF